MLVNREVVRQFGCGRDALAGQTVDVVLPDAVLAVPQDASPGGTAEGAFVLVPAARPS